MTWDDLKHFLAVARTGSLTAAGARLRTSASTVGRRLDALEKRLGVRLFERKSSGYVLTAAGRTILDKAGEVEEGILALERTALGADAKPAGKVRVAASDDIAAYVISPRLPSFFREYPHISLELVTQMETADLNRREADVALRGTRPSSGDFLVRHVGSWRFGLYCSRGYAKAAALRRGCSDFAHAGIVTWTDEYKHLRGGSWFAQYAAGARVALASNSPRVHYAACRAGLGLAILPAALAGADRDLICLLPPEQVLAVELWLVVHRDLTDTGRVRAVMQFLAQAAADAGPGMHRQTIPPPASTRAEL
jgi:DNA-binding transcriptional LysR family regulator